MERDLKPVLGHIRLDKLTAQHLDRYSRSLITLHADHSDM